MADTLMDRGTLSCPSWTAWLMPCELRESREASTRTCSCQGRTSSWASTRRARCWLLFLCRPGPNKHVSPSAHQVAPKRSENLRKRPSAQANPPQYSLLEPPGKSAAPRVPLSNILRAPWHIALLESSEFPYRQLPRVLHSHQQKISRSSCRGSRSTAEIGLLKL